MKELTRSERERAYRESMMIGAAERLFIENGYENVSMDEVARAAQFTKRTLYQYFTGKEDLFFAVTLKGFRMMASCCEKGFGTGKCGFDRLYNGVCAYHDFTSNNPGMFRLMNRVGYMRRRAAGSPKLDEWMQFDGMLFQAVAKVIEAGIEDGSIRNDIEPMKGTYSLIFLATGFMRLLNETGEMFAEHFDLDLDEFTRYSLSLLYDAIKPDKSKKGKAE